MALNVLLTPQPFPTYLVTTPHGGVRIDRGHGCLAECLGRLAWAVGQLAVRVRIRANLIVEFAKNDRWAEWLRAEIVNCSCC